MNRCISFECTIDEIFEKKQLTKVQDISTTMRLLFGQFYFFPAYKKNI